VPTRGLAPATWLSNGVPVSVTGDTNTLFRGFKDLVLLYELLRDHGRTAATLARLHLARGTTADASAAEALISDSYRYLLAHATVLQAMFPDLNMDDLRWRARTRGGHGGRERQRRRPGCRGAQPSQRGQPHGLRADFLMFVERFTGAETFFDSYDALKVRLDPDETNPLGTARDMLEDARTPTSIIGSRGRVGLPVHGFLHHVRRRLQDIVAYFRVTRTTRPT